MVVKPPTIAPAVNPAPTANVRQLNVHETQTVALVRSANQAPAKLAAAAMKTVVLVNSVKMHNAKPLLVHQMQLAALANTATLVPAKTDVAQTQLAALANTAMQPAKPAKLAVVRMLAAQLAKLVSKMLA